MEKYIKNYIFGYSNFEIRSKNRVVFLEETHITRFGVSAKYQEPKSKCNKHDRNYAFQFTSQIPKGISDRESPLWNRDIHCTGFNDKVKKAYLDQYSLDVKNILDARAEELVPGGLLSLSGLGLRDGIKMSETYRGIVLDLIGASLNDLAQQGAIEQDKVDSFNISFYLAEEGELRQIIKENQKFTIEVFEDIIQPNKESSDPKIFAASSKDGLAPILSAHFGAEAMRQAFELVEAKAHQNFSRIENAKPGMQYLIVLRKN